MEEAKNPIAVLLFVLGLSMMPGHNRKAVGSVGEHTIIPPEIGFSYTWYM